MSNQRRAHGPTVRAIREALGLSMDAVAARATISPGYLSKVERTIRRPEADVTARLAAALDVTPEILTGQQPAIGTIRAALGIEAVDFARDTGLTIGRLERIERGLDIADPDTTARIAGRLGIDRAALEARGFATA